mgnify:CR=1 FL=1
MRAINLKTNHLTAPVGIDAGPLFLSWQCVDGVRQTAYEIQLTANGEMLWHSGKTEGAAMHADVPAVVGSRVSGCWRVRLWDENDVLGAWSEARFETGLAQCDWVGEWVDPETEPIDIPGDDAINAFARPNWERKQAEKEAAGKGAAESYKPHRPASYLRNQWDNGALDYYGLQFWIVEIDGKSHPYMRGMDGQYIVAIPERGALFVRLGHKSTDVYVGPHQADLFRYFALASEILDARME